ncbi:LLM class flavin-dependent oxidoreductase [Streptomyces sp. ME19-01-6]|uniref:LLM class flavin-dependent oxidoreductase n=1 Tax=Streptomyces sp. ME19-01-6 TaxID=3028686 RepID=UPI0029A07365|nr:LLM class flavin-dependent oxidoreductase [Streptomyces sp. ME19-01-6]MDX3228668.1 LLM class flavin-dependent oxidoreductase [Streptomyces sp. ME19-01-6]
MVKVYSVTPESVPARSSAVHDTAAEGFAERLTTTARASERAGWEGILVPHNLHEVDPWIVAAHIGSATRTLVPLLALQPAATPPHTAALCAAAYAMLHGLPLYFNLVAGARDDEMRRIGDDLSHDERYARLRQYGHVLRRLLRGETVDAEGPYYTYRGFRLEPRPDVLSRCRIFVAGSSSASVSAAKEISDVVVTHPLPYEEWHRTFLRPLRADDYMGDIGIRIGILCRPDPEEAWKLAYERFPDSWIGRQETLLKTMSQNTWSRQLAQRAVEADGRPVDVERSTYWLGAFRSGLASAPFLVGGYDEVAARLGDYVRAGVGHVLLNGGLDEDFEHTREAVRLASRR